MNAEEIRELWGRFMEGRDLTARQQRDLVDALDADPALRESLIENLQIDGVLRELAAVKENGEAFNRILADCVGPEHDATRFIKTVELRLTEHEPPPSIASGTSRKVKPSTTRILRRSTPSSPGATAWRAAAAAAAAFIAILLLVTDFSPEPRKSAAGPKPRPAPIVAKEPSRAVEPPRRSPPAAEDELRRLRQLADLERERERLRTAPPAPNEKPGDRQRALAANDDDQRRIEEEMRQSIPRRENTTTTTTPRPDSSTVAATDAAAFTAVIERMEGPVYLVRSRTDMPAAKKGDRVPAGWDIETKGGTVILAYEDGTRVELGANSAFSPSPAAPGRRLVLKSGTLQSRIAKQPADRPIVFATPQAEATILGTTIRLKTSADPKVGTTLEVQEGRVRIARLSDARTVDVGTGEFATAASGIDLAPQKSFPDEILVKFGPYTPILKPGQLLDLGEEFTPARGYGWIGAGGDVIGEWLNPSTGLKEIRKSGRMIAQRTVAADVDPLKASDVVAGWTGHAETWKIVLPNGRYVVRVCCGDVTFEQGPHHVWVEGKQLIHEKKNKVGGWVDGEDVVEVKDGELTMKVGGNPGPRKSGDGSTDTLINFLTIRKLKK